AGVTARAQVQGSTPPRVFFLAPRQKTSRKVCDGEGAIASTRGRMRSPEKGLLENYRHLHDVDLPHVDLTVERFVIVLSGSCFCCRHVCCYRNINTIRREGGGTLRQARAGVRAQGISEQDRARAQQRRGRRAAAEIDAGILRLLRLALVGARALAARPPAADVSTRAICQRRARSAEAKSNRGESETGSGIY